MIGARLFQHGHDVVLIARGAHYEAIRDRGPRMQSPVEDVMLQIPVVDRPSDFTFTADDVVLLGDEVAGHFARRLDALPRRAARSPWCARRTASRTSASRCVASPNVYGDLRHAPDGAHRAAARAGDSARSSGILDIGRYPRASTTRQPTVAAALAPSTFVSVPRADSCAGSTGSS